MIAIPQHITEQIIGEAVHDRGISVLRPYTVVDLKPNVSDPKFTDVTFDVGHVLRARCVVGADGSHSIVRTTQLKLTACATYQPPVLGPRARKDRLG